MTTFNLTCDAVEATLPDYLDNALEGWLRESVDEHLAGCPQCSALLRDLRSNAREAAALPALHPEHDVWSRVARRIGGPTFDFDSPAEAQVPDDSESVVEAELTAESEWAVEIAALSAESAAPSVEIATPVPLTTELAAESEPPAALGEAALETPQVSSRVLNTEFTASTASEPPPSLLMPVTATLADVATPEGKGPVFTPESPVVTDDLPLERSKPLTVVSEPISPLIRRPEPTIPPTLPLRRPREKRLTARFAGLAAAALVVVTAGTTFLLTVHWVQPTQTARVASTAEARKVPSKNKSSTAPRTQRQAAEEGSDTQPSDSLLFVPQQPVTPAVTVSAMATPIARSPEDVVYDNEISTLSRIVRRQKSRLDPSTVSVIEKNLRTLDSAIAQIRAALEEDPNSSLIGGQESHALEMKVELLRRAAMLQFST